MTELLKIEWLKIKNYSAFIVLSLFYLVGILGSNYGVFYLKKNFIDEADPTKIIASSSPYDFANTWQTTSYVSGYLLMLPALLMILLVTNEFSFRTHRQNIIDGWSRKDFINVKIVIAVISAVASAVMVFLTALIFGFASGSSFDMSNIENIGYFFVKALSFNMIALLFAVLVRKTGFAIGLFFIYLGVETILWGILQGLSMKFKREYDFDFGFLGNYLPLNSSDSLVHFPKNAVSDMAKNASLMPHEYMYVSLAFALLYITVFYVWSRSRIIKTDL
jgi:ABC-2 type transport system permease protein